MERVTIREGNLPPKLRVIVINKLTLSGHKKPMEVYKCSPQEVLDYEKKGDVVLQPIKPFNEGGRTDGRWYIAAWVSADKTPEGLVHPTQKLLFAEVTPEWLRVEGRRRLKEMEQRRNGTGLWTPDGGGF